MTPEPSIWTPAMVSAIIGGLVLLIGALTTMIVTLHGLRKKTDTIIEQGVQIHTLTNSNLSAVTKTLEVAQARISGLEALVAAQDKSKGVADTLAAKRSEVAQPPSKQEPL